MYGYIYKTTNLINGRLYIGQTHHTFSPNYLGSGKTILKAIKKYGKENFKLEVIAYATTETMLDGLEKKFIYEYRQVFGKEFLYNITDGGHGVKGSFMNHIRSKNGKSNKGRKHTDEWKKKQLTWTKGNKGWTGKHRTEDEKKRISEKLKGIKRKPFTEEHKRKIREARKNQIFTEETLAKLKLRKRTKEAIYKFQMTRLKNWLIEKYNIKGELLCQK